MNKRTKRLAAIIAIALAVLMLFSLVFSVILSNTAGAASKLDDMKSKQTDIKAQKERIKNEISSIKSEKKSKIALKIALDEEIRLSEEEIDNTNSLIREYTLSIAENEAALNEATAGVKEKSEKFMMRLRAMEEMGETSYISVLLKSASFSDLLGRMSIAADVAADDERVIAELEAESEKIRVLSDELRLGKDEQLALRTELAQSQNELKNQYQALDELIADLNNDEEELKRSLAEQEKAEQELQNQIKKYLEEQAKKNSVYVGGDFLWPLPGYTTITSGFGMRLHPVLKVNKMHTGTDIGAPTGASIVAANSGTVILATYNGGYGNCVVIDHGGGTATLYGHASKLLVNKGDKVKKGDKIAKVGMTGTATGPHLHFEIIVNGAQKNPMNYFKKA